MAETARTFADPTDWDQLYPGRFMKAGEFQGKKPTLTITAVKLDELEGNKGKQVKGIISFKETEKALALNRTNGICIKAMFGKKVQEWVGKRITLFAGTWNGEDCIRVWGSPDIPAEFNAKVELPRKRPFDMTMHKVVKGGPQSVPSNDVPTGEE